MTEWLFNKYPVSDELQAAVHNVVLAEKPVAGDKQTERNPQPDWQVQLEKNAAKFVTAEEAKDYRRGLYLGITGSVKKIATTYNKWHRNPSKFDREACRKLLYELETYFLKLVMLQFQILLKLEDQKAGDEAINNELDVLNAFPQRARYKDVQVRLLQLYGETANDAVKPEDVLNNQEPLKGIAKRTSSTGSTISAKKGSNPTTSKSATDHEEDSSSSESSSEEDPLGGTVKFNPQGAPMFKLPPRRPRDERESALFEQFAEVSKLKAYNAERKGKGKTSKKSKDNPDEIDEEYMKSVLEREFTKFKQRKKDWYESSESEEERRKPPKKPKSRGLGLGSFDDSAWGKVRKGSQVRFGNQAAGLPYATAGPSSYAGAAAMPPQGNPQPAAPGLPMMGNPIFDGFGMTLGNIAFDIDRLVPQQFDGNNWEEFLSQWTAADLQMRGLRMTGCQKYLHLRNRLTGHALAYAGDLNKYEDESYEKALRILLKYFGKGTSELAKIMQDLLDTKEPKATPDDRIAFHGAVVKHVSRLKVTGVDDELALFALHLAIWERKMDRNMLNHWVKYKTKRANDKHPLGADIDFSDLDQCLETYIREQRELKAAKGDQPRQDKPVPEAKPKPGKPNTGKNDPKKGKGKQGGKHKAQAHATSEQTVQRNPNVNIEVPCTWCAKGKGQEFQHAFPLTCPKLKGKNPAISLEEAMKKILSDKLCFVCTAAGHTGDKCPVDASKIKCRVNNCGGHHCRYIHYHLKGEPLPTSSE